MAARAPTYDTLTKELLPKVARWEHASFVRNHLEPFLCERNGWKPGRLVAKAPKTRGYSYGFSADGKLLVAREGQFVFFHVHDADGITRLSFDASAIAWAEKQKGAEKDQANAKKLKSSARLVFENGRLVRVEAKWPGRPARVDTYEYDKKGRVVRVHVSEPKHVDEISYDASGKLAKVTWRHSTGHASERFRTPKKGDDLAKLLPQIKAMLLEQIPRTLARAKIRDAAYTVVICTCLEEAPHLLPPRLTVGLVKDRDAIIAKGGKYVNDEIWNPESMPLRDDARLDLKDRALLALCKRANVAREDDTEVLVMLRMLAAALQKRGLRDALNAAPELLVFAMDVGGESAENAAMRMAPAKIRAKLAPKKLRGSATRRVK